MHMFCIENQLDTFVSLIYSYVLSEMSSVLCDSMIKSFIFN